MADVSLNDKIAEVRKAAVAVFVPPLTALGLAVADGVVTPGEWIGIAVALLVGGSVAGVAVYQVPNATPAGKTLVSTDDLLAGVQAEDDGVDGNSTSNGGI